MNGAGADQEKRMQELESRLAFQDDLIESLNGVVARQDRELSRLVRRLDELERKLAEMVEAAALSETPAGHEVPPHY